jgi:hypothetical protein
MTPRRHEACLRLAGHGLLGPLFSARAPKQPVSGEKGCGSGYSNDPAGYITPMNMEASGRHPASITLPCPTLSLLLSGQRRRPGDISAPSGLAEAIFVFLRATPPPVSAVPDKVVQAIAWGGGRRPRNAHRRESTGGYPAAGRRTTRSSLQSIFRSAAVPVPGGGRAKGSSASLAQRSAIAYLRPAASAVWQSGGVRCRAERPRSASRPRPGDPRKGFACRTIAGRSPAVSACSRLPVVNAGASRRRRCRALGSSAGVPRPPAPTRAGPTRAGPTRPGPIRAVRGRPAPAGRRCPGPRRPATFRILCPGLALS